MRSFDVVDEKLAEADFFCEEIANAGYELHRVRFYFSAFVGAARSVTFALQGCLKHLPDFEEWYAPHQTSLRNDPLGRFFHECRTDSQHLGLNPVMGGATGDDHPLHFFGQPEIGRYSHIPETDVLTACRMHMKNLCTIIDACYRDLGLIIDPEQIYTVEGIQKLGMSIEDVEEELGLPRGWTDIPWDGLDKDAQRIRLLRRHAPKSRVKPLLKKYLGPSEPKTGT